MIDYCLKNKDEAEFNAVMAGCGLIDAEGNPMSYEVLIDRIGPITIWDYSVEPPTEITYPEYYSNVRLLMEPTEEEAAALAPFAIDPSSPHYRVWA